jgi:hypothetical protein
MTLDEQHKDAFAGYEVPLRFLENAFNSAGLLIKPRCFVAPANNKMVDVLTEKNYRLKLVCIEGDSPAQAVKDVAAGVGL